MDDKDKKIQELQNELIKTQKRLEKAELYNHIYMYTLDRMYEGVTFSFEEDNHKLSFYSKSNEKHDIYKEEDVLGRSVAELWGLEEQEATYYNDKPRLERKLIYQRPDGKEGQMLFSTYPYFENKKRIAYIAIRRDVTNLNTFIMKTYELQKQLNKEASNALAKNGTKYTLSSIVGDSPIMVETVELARRSAKHHSSILIYGETGTGKELFAQGIHNASARCDEPFIAVNCAAIPENLLESILFGSTKGSFTDAQEKVGLFEQAGKGTLFLDEINSMPLSMQVKILRVLQENMIRRVGGDKDIIINCRVISAMNLDPVKAVEQGLIRQDLYYRLGVVVLRIPPLRERKEDLPLLFSYFIKKYNLELSKTIEKADENLQNAFAAYHWPGNVREMEHMIESAMNFADDQQKELTIGYMPFLGDRPEINRALMSIKKQSDDEFDGIEGLEEYLKNLERRIIAKSIQKNNDNISATARELGISRESLYRKMKRLKISGRKQS